MKETKRILAFPLVPVLAFTSLALLASASETEDGQERRAYACRLCGTRMETRYVWKMVKGLPLLAAPRQWVRIHIPFRGSIELKLHEHDLSIYSDSYTGNSRGGLHAQNVRL